MGKPFSEPSNLTEQMQNLCWRLAVEMRSLFNTVSNKLSTDDADDRYLAKTGKAVSATTADTATKADSATTADTATMATQDGNGNVISSTYAKNTSIPTTMKGATSSSAGTSGTVPTPAAGTEGKFLRGDGTWQTPSVPTKTSELTNNSGFITSAALTDYAKTSAIPTAMTAATASAAGTSGIVPVPAAGANSKFLRGDATWQSISVPTQTSQLTNNSGFITSSALSDYAKTSSIPTKVSELENDSGFAKTSATLPVIGTVTMVSLGFTLNSTVSIVDFFKALYARFGEVTNVLVLVSYDAFAGGCIDIDGSSVHVDGGVLWIGCLRNLNASTGWLACSAVYFPIVPSYRTWSLYALNSDGTVTTRGRLFAGLDDIPTGTALSTSYHSGTTWYRKFSDGFIMQGGEGYLSSGSASVTFPTAFTTSDYTVNCTIKSAWNISICYTGKSTTTCSISASEKKSANYHWMAFGY